VYVHRVCTTEKDGRWSGPLDRVRGKRSGSLESDKIKKTIAVYFVATDALS
jgi:hypothetical protein